MRKMYFVWVVLALGMFVLGVVFAAGSARVFVNLAALIVVIVPTFALLLGNYSFREFGRCFSIGFSPVTPSAADLAMGVVFFRSLGRYAIISGLIGFFIGIVVSVSSLYEDPKDVGIGVGISLMTLLYGLAIKLLIAGPFQTGLEKRQCEIGSQTTN